MKLIKPLLIIFGAGLLCYGQKAYAQEYQVQAINSFNNGDIKLTVNGSVAFKYKDLDDMTKPQTLQGIYRLKMKAKSQAYKVVASVSFDNPSAVTAFTNKLKLKLLPGSPTGVTILQSEAFLSSNPTDLFQMPISSNAPGVEQFRYFDYDLAMLPLTQFVNPGIYSFAVTFTMTQP